MSSFRERISIAEKFERVFIEAFNKYCKNYRIVKFGIESTNLLSIHEHIRLCHDETTKFIRYLPDSVLVNINQNNTCKTTLIEFKAASTGIKKDLFLHNLNKQCNDTRAIFTCKEDIFNIEDDALELYKKLHTINVKIIIIAYAQYRPLDDQIRAQFVENIAKCNTYNPNTKGKNTGSGTNLANVNFLSFDHFVDFFHKQFEIEKLYLNKILEEIKLILHNKESQNSNKTI
jgi:hypothetical protein